MENINLSKPCIVLWLCNYLKLHIFNPTLWFKTVPPILSTVFFFFNWICAGILLWLEWCSTFLCLYIGHLSFFQLLSHYLNITRLYLNNTRQQGPWDLFICNSMCCWTPSQKNSSCHQPFVNTLPPSWIGIYSRWHFSILFIIIVFKLYDCVWIAAVTIFFVVKDITFKIFIFHEIFSSYLWCDKTYSFLLYQI